MLGIEQHLANDLRCLRAARLANHDGVDPGLSHQPGQRLDQCGFSRALRPFENDEEAPRGHPRVMMLLAAPFSMPSLICWFTLAINFSKLERATT